MVSNAIIYSQDDLQKLKLCKTCIYHADGQSAVPTCDYIGITKKRRPCSGTLFSADGSCSCYEKPGKKKKTRRLTEHSRQSGKNFHHHGYTLIQSQYSNNYCIYEDINQPAVLRAEYDKPLDEDKAKKLIEAFESLMEE